MLSLEEEIKESINQGYKYEYTSTQNVIRINIALFLLPGHPKYLSPKNLLNRYEQNYDCTNRPPCVFFEREAVLTNTHNLCFGTKIRKIGMLLRTPVLLYKIIYYIHCTDMFS